MNKFAQLRTDCTVMSTALVGLGMMTSSRVRLSSRCAFNTVTGIYELRGSFQSKKQGVAADCDEHSMERVSAARARSGCGRRVK